jgi:hypothetical protein
MYSIAAWVIDNAEGLRAHLFEAARIVARLPCFLPQDAALFPPVNR